MRRLKRGKIPQAHKYILPWELLHESAADYVVSKQTEQWPKKTPLIDSPPARTALAFIDALCEAHKVRGNHHSNLKPRSDELQQQWEEVISKSEQLKISIINSEKLVTLGEFERERLKRKLSEFEPSRRYQGIAETQAAILQLDSVEQLMEKQLQALSVYEEFLKKVVNSDSLSTNQNTAFKSPDEILQRYMVLLDAQKHAAERANLLDHDADGARAAMENLHQNHAAKLTGLRTIWAKMQEKYNSTKADVSFWEGNLGMVLKTTLTSNTDTERVKQAIIELYERMCTLKDIDEADRHLTGKENQQKFSSDNYESLLTLIKAAIKRIEKVYNICLSESESAALNVTE